MHAGPEGAHRLSSAVLTDDEGQWPVELDDIGVFRAEGPDALDQQLVDGAHGGTSGPLNGPAAQPLCPSSYCQRHDRQSHSGIT